MWLMSLTNCPDCGRQVSTSAAACPNCGRPIAPPAAPQQPQRVRTSEDRALTRNRGFGDLLLIPIVVLAIVLLVGLLLSPSGY